MGDPRFDVLVLADPQLAVDTEGAILIVRRCERSATVTTDQDEAEVGAAQRSLEQFPGLVASEDAVALGGSATSC